MFRLAASMCLVLATLPCGVPRAAADIVVGLRFRETFTRASAVGPFVDDGTTSTSGGTFADAAASLDSNLTFGTFTADASHSSTIPDLTGPSMSGSGAANGAATILAPGGGYILADSVFDVRFTVDAPASYLFSAGVSYSEVAPFGVGFGTLGLFNLTTLSQLAFLQKSDSAQGTTAVAQSLVLTPGNTYRLYAAAQVGGNASLGDFNGTFVFPQTSSAAASWSFSLIPTAVPEASTVVALGLVGVMAAAKRWLHRRRPSQKSVGSRPCRQV
jgi:hypothetical protein